MKHLSKFVSAIILSLILFACSEEDKILNDPINTTTYEEALKTNKGILTLKNVSYIANNNGLTHKFKDKKLKYTFIHESKLEFKINEKLSSKGNTNEVLVENSNTNEYILFNNYTQLEDKIIQFDVVTSNGVSMKSIKYDYSSIDVENSSSSKCPLCWGWLVAELVEIIVDATGDNYDSNCRAAIEACGDNGVSSIEITEGWFTNSCSVKCK